MISSLYQNGVVQFLLVVLTAPIWSPILKLLWSEMNLAAERREPSVRWWRELGSKEDHAAVPGAPFDVAPATGTGHGHWLVDEDETWSRRRMVNAAWDTGRRSPGGPPGRREPGELTRRVLEASERGAHGFGERPI